MAQMDIPQVLEELGLASEDWGPNGNSKATYEEFAATWRGSVPIPTKQVMLATWGQIEADNTPGKIKQKRRELIAQKLTSTEDIDIVWDALILINQRLTALENRPPNGPAIR